MLILCVTSFYILIDLASSALLSAVFIVAPFRLSPRL